MCVVIGHQIDKIEVQTLELFIGSDFELAVIHLAGLIEGGGALGHLGFLEVVFYLLAAGIAGSVLVGLEAADTDVSFAFGGIAQDLAALLFLALVADVAADRHCLQFLDQLRLPLFE